MPATRRTAVVMLAIVSFTALAACAGGDASTSAAPEVTRRDSSGVAIVENRGGDRMLDWRFTEVLRLGGADAGPEAFYDPVVDTDAHGRIYVLNRGEHQVIVFDSTGRHLRTFGRKGGGPGEMERPAQIAVTADGTVGVHDWGKGAVVRWDSAGEPMAQLRLAAPMLYDLQPLGDGFAGEFARMSGFGEERDSTSFTLMHLGAAEPDSGVVTSLRIAPGHEVDFGCVRISSMDPLFQPDLRWAVAASSGAPTPDAGDRFVLATSTRYELELRDASGALVGLVRRDVEPQPATEELAMQEVGDSMRVGFGGGRECVIPVEKVVEQRGHGDVVPAVRQLVAGPDGGWWAFRGVGKRDDQIVDVFDADGAYIGTLPADAPYPNAFLPGGSIVTIERDDMDLPYVVVYGVAR